MTQAAYVNLSRRERQIMDIVYRAGSATAADVHQALPDPPSYSAVRALLRILEDKGHLRHRQDGAKYVFLPTVTKNEARTSVLSHILQTFFEGSAETAVAALLDMKAGEMESEELNRLADLVERARLEGR